MAGIWPVGGKGGKIGAPARPAGQQQWMMQQQQPQAETFICYCTEDKDEIGIETLAGEYREEGANHGRKFFKKTQIPGDEDINVYLYFWDDRDGEAFTGWWFGNEVGGDQVWSRSKLATQKPPKSGWTIPWDGVVKPELVVKSKQVFQLMVKNTFVDFFREEAGGDLRRAQSSPPLKRVQQQQQTPVQQPQREPRTPRQGGAPLFTEPVVPVVIQGTGPQDWPTLSEALVRKGNGPATSRTKQPAADNTRSTKKGTAKQKGQVKRGRASQMDRPAAHEPVISQSKQQSAHGSATSHLQQQVADRSGAHNRSFAPDASDAMKRQGAGQADSTAAHEPVIPRSKLHSATAGKPWNTRPRARGAWRRHC